MDDYQETGICSLCGGTYIHWGHSPAPIKDCSERCCDSCNATRVIPTRLGMLGFTPRLHLVEEVVRMATTDVQDGIPERHKTNTGAALAERLKQSTGYHTVYNGDPKALRQIYTGVYWMLRMSLGQEGRWDYQGRLKEPVNAKEC